MPANVSWRELYKTELFQLAQEGCELDGMEALDLGAETLPIPRGLVNSAAEADEQLFRRAYAALLERRDQLPHVLHEHEPNDLNDILRLAPEPPVLTPPSDAAYEDRVRGAWFGRCAAVILGKPLEMGFDRHQVERYLRSVDAYPLRDWVPGRSEALDITLRHDCVPSTKGHVRYVQSDDDIHYTICSLLLIEQHGESFSRWQAAENLLDNICYHWLWTADRALYTDVINIDMAEDIDAQLTASALRNPWRESMCPQLKADLWGYVTPADPRRGATMIHRLGSLSATKNGLYGGLFIQGCVSGAMSANPSVASILSAGLCNIPRGCRLAEAVRRVTDWHAEGRGWSWVCDRIYGHYGHWYFAGAINNICFIVLALLEGDLDFERTICTAVMCGTDTDCNSANAGSIVGAAIGYEALPQKWIAPLGDEVRSCVAGFGFGTISELADRTIAQRVGGDIIPHH